MGVRFQDLYLSVYSVGEEKEKKAPHLNAQEIQEGIQNEPFEQEKFDFSCMELISSYKKADLRMQRRNSGIKDGHSRYEYKGARFDVYKKEDKYRSEFVYPEGFDTDEFIEKFPELESQPIIKSNGGSGTIDRINGEIDETVSQSSYTGDCWLLASVTSLSKTEKGKEIIKKAITVNDDNTVTVSFRGIGVSYTLSEEEIKQYDTDSNTYDSYSNGDNDMLVLELAVEKLWKDINLGKVKLETNNENITSTSYGIEEGGLPSQMIYYLTGVESKEYYNDDLSALRKNDVYKVLNGALNTENTVLNIGIYDGIHSCKLVDGSTFSIDLGSGGHALAVTKVTENTVTFVNPWDTSIEYTASWEEFASLNIGYISSSDLSQSKEKEVVDMTDNKNYNYGYTDRYGYNYDYNYDYDYENYRYDRYDRNNIYEDFDRHDDKFKPDFDEDFKNDINDYFEPDFDNDKKKTPEHNNDFDIQSYIDSLLEELMSFFESLFSLWSI